MDDAEIILQQLSREQLILMALGFVLLILGIVLAYHVRSLIQLVREENRFFKPGHSWVLAIPLINIFYNFVIVRRLVASLNNEFYDRKEAVEENPTLRSGYFMAFSYLAANFPLPLFIGYLVYIICLVYYIQYLAKVIAYKKLLLQPPPSLRDKEIDGTESDW